MSGNEELLDTIEQIRKEKFADLPADLVKEIVLIEADFTDNRQEANRRITQAIDTYMEKLAAQKETGVK